MTDTAIGPVEYVLLHFAGNSFTGDIAPALSELLDRGLVRIIDLSVVSRDTGAYARGGGRLRQA